MVFYFLYIHTHIHTNTLLYVLAQWVITYISCISYMLKFILKSVYDMSVMWVRIREFNKIVIEFKN